MSSVLTQTANTPRRQYIATGVFNNNIFNYSTSVNASLVTVGSLVVNPNATVLNCKAGHILRENGKRLIKDVNPNITDPTNGASYTYLVGVFDANSFLNGFIDPNSPLFAIYNSDKPIDQDSLTEGVDGSTGLQDLGQPVFTRGNITTTSGQISCNTLTTLTTLTLSTPSGVIAITINPALGQVFSQTITLTSLYTGNFTINTATIPPVGTTVYLIVKTGASHGLSAVITQGTNIKMNTITLSAASKVWGVTLVSDGTALIQVGGDVIPVAM
jgi:hypothetical protein